MWPLNGPQLVNLHMLGANGGLSMSGAAAKLFVSNLQPYFVKGCRYLCIYCTDREVAI